MIVAAVCSAAVYCSGVYCSGSKLVVVVKLAIKGDVKQEFNDVTLTYRFMNSS